MTIQSEDGRSGADAPSGCQPEEWRDVVGYEGLYEVSSLGRVRSRFAVNGHCLSTAGTDKDGYPVVSLSAPDGRHTFTLHRVVCRAFHGEPTALHNEVAHLDGVRTNARADNLQWASKVENHFHMRAHGTHPAGDRHPKARLTWGDVHDIRALPDPVNNAAVGRRYGVTAGAIWDVRRGRTWRAQPSSDVTELKREGEGQ
jgi:hypothetical protein